MPDHDTFDLDAAFRGLEQDIAGSSSPHGARAAIAVARRRRRTTLAGAAALVALVAGAAVVGQGLATRDDSVGPAQLPAPAAFDASALSAATQGWTSDWRTPTRNDQPALPSSSAPRCLQAVEAPSDKQVTPDPARSGGGLLVTDDEGSLATLVEWGDDHPGASTVGYDAVVTTIDRCADASPAHDYTWDGARGRSWTITAAGDSAQHIWVAQTGRAVGVLWTGGTAGPVPDAVDERVISTLVAGLQSERSFSRDEGSTASGGSSSGSSSGPSSASSGSGSPVATVSDADFAGALAGWDNAWRRGGDVTSESQVPCADGWSGAAGSGSGSSLGANGYQEYDAFSSTAEARSAVDVIRKSLAGCGGPAYQVSTLSDAPDSSVAVASGPEVVWIVRQGSVVGVIVVPGGSSPPPDTVTGDVSRLMLAAMRPQPQPVESTVAASPN